MPATGTHLEVVGAGKTAVPHGVHRKSFTPRPAAQHGRVYPLDNSFPMDKLFA
jgi:hypothetical protein